MKRTTKTIALLALVAGTAGPLTAQNGVILISTRAPQDTQFNATEYISDEKGPGMATPGDVAMASLLSDNGYSCRLILDRLLGAAGSTVTGTDPSQFLQPVNTNMNPILAIMSGSGASADTPPPPEGVPIMMGEHVCLGNNAARPGSLYLYNGTASNDPNESTVPAVSHYMVVVAPDHPIMKGVPRDAQNRVKIFRDRYPNEESHVPPGGKPNFEFRWCTQAAADAAACTTVLGVLDGANDRSCFAVADVGGLDANGATVASRRVHLFVNENGSGGTRRGFLALTDIGRVLFVRAARWAMGETLEPYPGIRITDISSPGAQQVRLSWEGSASSNYKIQATTDFASWQTVIQDIAGKDGLVTRTLGTADAPSTLYLRVGSMP